MFDELGGEALSYVDPEGVAALRAELAQRGRVAGFASSPEEIIVTSGARQGLDLVRRAGPLAGRRRGGRVIDLHRAAELAPHPRGGARELAETLAAFLGADETRW